MRVALIHQQDRVDVLKKVCGLFLELGPHALYYFEHLGGNTEEQQWANYRIAESPSKGIMMGKMTDIIMNYLWVILQTFQE
jgi:hypothetical protein